ncbi:MAG: TIGR01777 family oxidoreductase [Candidatus Goldbacteria bacterium]|nr:TIGR01777 family oxidoreductase [Candidatus Goldiibacteriota bacterium]
MRKVVITGGTGFIGNALAHRFIKKGYEVIGVSRDPFNKKSADKHIRYVPWDEMRFEIEGAEAVINLAGAPIIKFPLNSANKKSIIESRLNAGEAVTFAVKKAEKKPKVVIQASAVGFYGSTGNEGLDENSSKGTGFLSDLCRRWEDSTAQVERMGVRRCIIRTGIVLGHGGFLNAMSLPFKFFAGGAIGSGRQYHSWIHVKDEIHAIIHLIENPDTSGIYNLTAPEPVTNREFSKMLGRVLRRPSFFRKPKFLVKIIAGELADEVLLAGQKVYPKRLLEAGFKFGFPSLETALKEIYGKKQVL